MPEQRQRRHATAMPGLAVRTDQNGRRPEIVGVLELMQGQSDVAQVGKSSCPRQPVPDSFSAVKGITSGRARSWAASSC